MAGNQGRVGEAHPRHDLSRRKSRGGALVLAVARMTSAIPKKREEEEERRNDEAREPHIRTIRIRAAAPKQVVHSVAKGLRWVQPLAHV